MIIQLLKSIPIDLGQGNLRNETKGKLIALSHVPTDGQGRTLLDIGCREGFQSEEFKKLGYKVTSVDIENVYENCTVVDCNKKLPFEDQSFDIIWSSEVIEHLIDPLFSTSEMRRVLKPGGKIILTTPNSFAFFFCLLALIGLTPQKIQRRDHIHFFDYSIVKRMYPKAQILGYLPFTYLRPCISKLVGFFSPTFVIVDEKREEVEPTMESVFKL